MKLNAIQHVVNVIKHVTKCHTSCS